MKKTTKRTQKKESKKLPTKWCVTDDIITRFATNCVIHVMGDNLIKISFFEAKPEMLIKKGKSKYDRADCVASIIMHANRVSNLVKCLENQLEFSKELNEQDPK